MPLIRKATCSRTGDESWVTLWMIDAFAVGTATFSPANGGALSFGTTFIFWVVFDFRNRKS